MNIQTLKKKILPSASQKLSAEGTHDSNCMYTVSRSPVMQTQCAEATAQVDKTWLT